MITVWRSVIFMALVCGASAVISVSYSNGWGDWGAAEACPGGSVGTGFSLKVENDHGGAWDDTGLNAIRIQCRSADGADTGVMTSTEGEHGEWTDVQECPAGSYLAAFRMQSVPNQGSLLWNDDVSSTDIDFYCADSAGAETGTLAGTGEAWGDWGDKSDNCPTGQAVCGIRTRVEAELGGGMIKDDTALNDVVFYCCDLIPTSNPSARELQDEAPGLEKDISAGNLKLRLVDLLNQLEARSAGDAEIDH